MPNIKGVVVVIKKKSIFYFKKTKNLVVSLKKLNYKYAIKHPRQIILNLYSKIRSVILFDNKSTMSIAQINTISKRRKIILFSLGLLIVLIPIAYLTLKKPQKVEASWWNDSWLYRKSIAISYSGSTTLSNFQVKLYSVDTNGLYSQGRVNTDCSDIRFVDNTGKVLNYWIEDWDTTQDVTPDCSSARYSIWVNVPSIPNGGTTIYMYYGNVSATSTYSNGNATFDFFDDFSSGSIDSTKWDQTGTGITVTGGNLKLNAMFAIQRLQAKFYPGVSSTPTNNDPTVITTSFQQKDSKSAGTANYAYFGFSNADFTQAYMDGDAAFFNFDNTTGGNFETATTRLATTTYSTVPVTEDTGFHTYTVSWETSKVNFYIDGTSNSITLTQPQSGTLQIEDPALSASSFHYELFDYIFVRKYASTLPTTPTYTSYGAEERSPGPVVYFKLDEGYGSIAHDSSSSRNDGTITDSTWRTDEICRSGNCLEFNGSNDYISVTSNDTIEFDGSGSFTVQAWVRHKPMLYGQQAIVSKYFGGPAAGGFVLYFDGSGDIKFGIDDDNSSFPEDVTTSTTANYDDNQWHFVVGTKTNASNIKLYIDGKLIDTDSSLSSNTGVTDQGTLRVGVVDTIFANARYTGLIDEVKLYPYARSLDQIKTDYVGGGSGSHGATAVLGQTNKPFLSEGLVGYWPLDEYSSGAGAVSRYDYSGNGNTLTDTNTVTSTSGHFGNAALFAPASSERLEITDANQNGLEGGSAITICSWFYQTTASGSQSIVGKWTTSGNNKSYRLSTYNSSSTNLYFLITTDGSTDVGTTIGTRTLSTNTWYHGCGTYDGKNLRVYLNGSDEGFEYTTSESLGGDIYDSSTDLRIGDDGNGAYFFGYIDDTRIYNRALSAGEIAQLYNWGPGPIAYWDMEEDSGTTVYDKAESISNTGDYDLTFRPVMNNTNWQPGKFGGGVYLDGSDECLYREAAPYPHPDNITIDGWMKLEGPNSATILTYGDTYWGTYPYRFIAQSDGSLRFIYGGVGTANTDIYSSNTSDSLSIVNFDGNWHHYAVTFTYGSPSTMAMYIDGYKTKGYWMQGDGTRAKYDSTNARLVIGNYFRYTTYCAYYAGTIGRMDEVKIYDYLRTQQQIIEDMNAGHPPPGSPVGSPVAYWNFDEGYSTVAHDKSQNALDLTMSNTSAWTNSGKYGKALGADGSYYATINDTELLDFASTDDMTISFWFNRAPFTPGKEYMVTKSNLAALGAGYEIWFNGSGDVGFGISDSATGIEDTIGERLSKGYDDGSWHHVGAVKKGNEYIKLYVDGVEIDSDSSLSAAGNLNNSNAFRVGWIASMSFAGKFNGVIDEVKVYRSVLTSDQIKMEYNQGKALVLGSTSTIGGAISNSSSRSYCTPGDKNTCDPPVFEYKFDENKGVNVYDTSGNNLNDNFSGGASWASDCKFGSCMHTQNNDGVQDYITVNNNALLEFTNSQDFTVSIWVKLVERENTVAVFLDKGASSGNGGYDVSMNSSYKFRCEYNDGAGTWDTALAANASSLNEWHHIECVMDRDGSEIGTAGYHIFIDGVLSGSDTSLTAGDGADGYYMTIGEVDDAYEETANIDQIDIFRYARTPAQIAWDYNQGKPKAWYKFDECEGSTVYNSAPTASGAAAGNNGTITIGAQGTQTSVGSCSDSGSTKAWVNGKTGKRNSAMSFDGTDDYITLGSDTLWYKNRPGSITFWTKCDGYSVSNYPVVLNIKSDDTSDGYRIFYSATTNYTGINIGDNDGVFAKGVTAGDISSYLTGSWRFVALVYNGGATNTLSNYTVYVDGIEQTLTTSGGVTSPPNTSYIGTSDKGHDHYFDGLIDDVRIYNYDLTQEQIKTVMNDGAVRYGPDTGPPE